LDTQLDRLERLLRESDADAATVLDALMAQARDSGLAQQLKPVAQAVDNFDFDVALEQLTLARKAIP
jgi:hypothetical protein